MKTHNVFWTGGFDSTYRVAEILANGRGMVRPVYVIDRERKSFPMELSAISALRAMLIRRFDCERLFLPTELYLRDDFPPCKEVSSAFKTIKNKVHIGSQYEWLAQFGRTMDARYGKIELCAERHDPPVEWYVKVFNDPYAFPPKLKDDSAECLFGGYSFPILHLTIKDMESNARKLGFYDILQKTWFCHRPVGELPCGGCNPCRLARLGKNNIRYAFLGRERQLISSVYRKVKNLSSECNEIRVEVGNMYGVLRE